MMRQSSGRTSLLGYYSLRTLLAVTAGIAFVAFIARWMLTFDESRLYPMLRLALFLLPWAIGSFLGIAIAARYQRSSLLGAICGGILGAWLCPGLPFVYSYANGLHGVRSLSLVGEQLAFAACGSGLLAGIVGILREGITLRSKAEGQPDMADDAKREA